MRPRPPTPDGDAPRALDAVLDAGDHNERSRLEIKA
jgi:hypothetical protein